MLGVAAGFAILISPPPFLRGTVAGIVPALLYSAIPLLVLALVSRGHWRALFRRLRGVDFLWMVVLHPQLDRQTS